jgi:hypothetical protein
LFGRSKPVIAVCCGLHDTPNQSEHGLGEVFHPLELIQEFPPVAAKNDDNAVTIAGDNAPFAICASNITMLNTRTMCWKGVIQSNDLDDEE